MTQLQIEKKTTQCQISFHISTNKYNKTTRHRASTSTYSLIFCVPFFVTRTPAEVWWVRRAETATLAAAEEGVD